jgi:CubicO group peptidase (beta-lactamase class C family)
MLVAPGFEPVADAFTGLMADGHGLAFAATVDGAPVVDLWGGTIEGTRQWVADTPALVFSGTKGIVATALLMLVDRGALEIDQAVSDVWPEFAVAGKQAVRISHILSHTAGLPAVETAAAPVDQMTIAGLLAAQMPMVPVGAPSYHALTFGALCDGLIRRVDGRSTGRFVADEIAGPLGLDLWIGTPPDVAARTALPFRRSDFRLAAELAPKPDPRLGLVYGLLSEIDWLATLGLEIPSANGVATARSLARLYGCLACGGEIDGFRLLSPEVLALARQELSNGLDPLSGRKLRFSAGFELTGTPSELGPIDDAFGFTGSGGSSHGAWPSRRVGFSFVITEMRPESEDDRAHQVLDALAACTR